MMHDSSKRPLKYLIFQCMMAIVIVVFCSLILEILGAQLLPRLDFSAYPREIELRELEENFSATTIPNLFFVPKANSKIFNSLRICDREYPQKKSPEVVRIMVFGDSITQGAGYVPFDKTYHEILEKRINENSTINYEVWNCGVRKYNTLQEFLYFKHYFSQYDPDIVILGYLELNDYDSPKILRDKDLSIKEDCYIAMVPKFMPIPDDWHRLLSRSHSYKIINMFTYTMLGNFFPEKYPPIVFKNTVSLKHVDLNRQALKDFKSFCDQKNIKFLLTVFPLLINQPFEDRDQWIYNISNTIDVEAIYLLPIYQKHHHDLRTLRCGVDSIDHLHPNETGHMLAANEIYKKMLSLEWIKDDNSGL